MQVVVTGATGNVGTSVLGQLARRDAIGTLAEMIEGIGRQTDAPTPPLARSTSVPGRAGEVKTGLGARP